MFRRFLMSTLALALVAAACGGSNQVAATYAGGEITVTEVNALIPGDGDTVDTTAFASTLFDVIVDRVFGEAAEAEYDVVPDQARVDESRQALVDEVTSNGQIELEEGLAANGLTSARLDAIARQRIVFDDIQLALAADQDPISDAELQEAFDLQLPTLAEVCSRHILLETEEEAVAAYDRAVAGEDFATLAMELSTGPSGPDGGDLGCTPPSGFVVEFADATLAAEVGVPFGPVRSSFGWHVILVESRTVPELDDVRASLESTIAGQRGGDLFNAWLIEKLTEADVMVEEQYGTWTLDPTPAVTPPA